MQIYRWYHQQTIDKQPVTGPGRIQPVRPAMPYMNKEDEEEKRRDQERMYRHWSDKYGYYEKGSLLDKRI
ncbi:hypothetical protein DUZ99_16950 [Xylanibacillus composti]|uniref:Uncharacterized protein n=1 Tax=Xylanibacillus composti TaxID=1572762 RepID=A0A8J4H1U8_9BACL|nr:hypothetical protein [Xylanibacillus composti]MDT9726666.1 hypothetical protein [Xylanibacillus composti]GIQ69403.1 hypothetical protein XYCOK13_22270 [Xylanibacillus composti]